MSTLTIQKILDQSLVGKIITVHSWKQTGDVAYHRPLLGNTSADNIVRRSEPGAPWVPSSRRSPSNANLFDYLGVIQATIEDVDVNSDCDGNVIFTIRVRDTNGDKYDIELGASDELTVDAPK